MSRRRPSSALSDMIRQATASEVLPGSEVPQLHTADSMPERPAQLLPSAMPATAEELAEAFFPGSSIREHAFFPKSLTQLSQSHTQRGFLGSWRREHGPQNDASQALGTSPPYAVGSMRGTSGATGGGIDSAATNHSLHPFHQQPSHVETDTENGGVYPTATTTNRDATASVAASGGGDYGHSYRFSPINTASAPRGGDSWSAWQRWMSPGQTEASSENASLPHSSIRAPQPQSQLPSSLPPGSFILQRQLSRRLSLTRDGDTAEAHQRLHHHHDHDPHAHHWSAVKEQAGMEDTEQEEWQGGEDLTAPLLIYRQVRDKSDVETVAYTQRTTTNAVLAGSATSSAVANSSSAETAAAAAAAVVGGGGHVDGHEDLSPELRRRSSFFNAVVFGIINAVVSMPTLIAYAAIVFKAPVYTPYLDSLCRFFFFSSGIHQLVFVALSTLPFAIGQVQDVGLIFLSAMASDIALRVTGPDAAAVALGSSLLAMTLSTLIVGLLTVCVARLKLADMVSYVPLPVVGGYLGFVGYFCIAGGTALAAGVQVDTLVSWANLLAWNPMTKLIPAAASITLLMLCVEHVSHPLALPGLLTAIPLAFHGVVWAIGWDLNKAQQEGWIMPPTAGLSNCWQLWGLFNLQNGGLTHGVNLGAILAQVPKLVGLFLVVCFGSCMDVAAIQSDMPTPLDFNKELMTVGVSNMVTGALGAGYTGSYIFSQTVFTMRQGVFNRVNGLMVAIMELLVFALPFSVVQYMPNFFFGALLVWFGIEISRDWLILSYRKLSRAEYVLLWATFVSIMNLGLELGIAAGIVMATLYFAYQYAQSQVSSLRQVAARSGRTHMYDTSSTLDLLGRRLAMLRLSGFVFFGSSTGISNQVLQLAARMLQERAEEQRQHEQWALLAEQRDTKDSDMGCRADAHQETPPQGGVEVLPVSASSLAVEIAGTEPGTVAPGAVATAKGLAQVPEADMEPQPAAAGAAVTSGRATSSTDSGDSGLSSSERHWRTALAISHAPISLILDFGSVSGIDSTAARTFATLVSTLASQRVNVIFANLSRADCRQLMEANGLPLRPYVIPSTAAVRASGPAAEGRDDAVTGAMAGSETTAGKAGQQAVQQRSQSSVESPLLRPVAGGCWEFSSAAAAVRCCEDSYLALAIAVGLLPAAPPQAASLQQLLARNLREYFPYVPPDLGGLVAQLEGALTRRQLQLGDVLYGSGAVIREVYVIEFGALVEEEHYEGGVRVGAREHGAGVVVGALECFLGRPAAATVRCSCPVACQVLCISQGAVARLMAQHPRALAALQMLLIRSTCQDLASAQEAANHGAAV